MDAPYAVSESLLLQVLEELSVAVRERDAEFGELLAVPVLLCMAAAQIAHDLHLRRLRRAHARRRVLDDDDVARRDAFLLSGEEEDIGQRLAPPCLLYTSPSPRDS